MTDTLPLDAPAIMNAIGHGVLVFTLDGALAWANDAARAQFGSDMKHLREHGWEAAALLFNTQIGDPDRALDAVRARALVSDRPMRFRGYLSGEYMPCWAAAVTGRDGATYLMLTIEQTDWDALSDIVGRYIDEVRNSSETTSGHAGLISQTLNRRGPNDTAETLTRKIGGFARVIHIHMHRLSELSAQMERFAAIRTNRVREQARKTARRIRLADFVDNFIENIHDDMLADPETDRHDHRRRIKAAVPPGLLVSASPTYLTAVLRDILRNAIMYSLKGTPVDVIAHASPRDGTIQIDIIDQGYGIREGESERVFQPFARARQPQIMGEFGYGLSLYLCKHEMEAMGGRLWFTSQEGVGSTFSIKVPVWREEYGETVPAPAYASLFSPTDAPDR
jgi:signal transduction histidine kinase